MPNDLREQLKGAKHGSELYLNMNPAGRNKMLNSTQIEVLARTGFAGAV